MVESWLLAHAGNDANRARLRYLIDHPPAPTLSAAPDGPAPGPRRGRGMSVEEARRMAEAVDSYDGSMGA